MVRRKGVQIAGEVARVTEAAVHQDHGRANANLVVPKVDLAKAYVSAHVSTYEAAPWNSSVSPNIWNNLDGCIKNVVCAMARSSNPLDDGEPERPQTPFTVW